MYVEYDDKGFFPYFIYPPEVHPKGGGACKVTLTQTQRLFYLHWVNLHLKIGFNYSTVAGETERLHLLIFNFWDKAQPVLINFEGVGVDEESSTCIK